MKIKSAKFSNYVWPSISIILIALVFGFSMYVNMKTKELHLNTMYLRQLAEFGREFENNTASLRLYANLKHTVKETNSNTNEQGIRDGDKEEAKTVLKHRLGDLILAEDFPGDFVDAEQPCDRFSITPRNSKSPYPTSRLQLSVCIELNGKEQPFNLPLEGLMPKRIGEFSTFLVASNMGNVLYQIGQGEGSIDSGFVNIGRLLARYREEEGANKSNMEHQGSEKNDGESFPKSVVNEIPGFLNAKINGIAYRAYVFPHPTPKLELQLGKGIEETNSSTIFLVGLVPHVEIRRASMQLSSRAYLLLLSTVLAIMLTFVFFKVKFSQADAALRPSDAITAMLAIDIFIMISLIAISAYTFSEMYRRQSDMTAQELVRAIGEDFERQLKDHLGHATKLLGNENIQRVLTTKLENSEADRIAKSEGKFSAYEQDSEVSQHENYQHRNFYLTGEAQRDGSTIENIFLANEDGDIAGSLIRGSKNLIRQVEPPNVGSRKYFQDALDHKVWPVSVGDKVYPITIERIFNMLDGVRSTQVSFPVATSEFTEPPISEWANGKGRVIAFGAEFPSLLAPILPLGYQFAIFENRTGRVVYHSDEERSLVENVYNETMDSNGLASFVRLASDAPGSHVDGGLPIWRFSSLYRGNPTKIYAAPLHSDIPWTVLITRDVSHWEVFDLLLLLVPAALTTVYFALLVLSLMLLRIVYRRPVYHLWPQGNDNYVYEKSILALVVGSVISFFILRASDSFLAVWGSALFLNLTILVLVNCYFRQSYLRPSRPAGPRILGRKLGYIAFICTLIFTSVGIPSLVITQKVGEDLVFRLSSQRAIAAKEAETNQKNRNAARFNRLCGLSQNGSSCSVIESPLETISQRHMELKLENMCFWRAPSELNAKINVEEMPKKDFVECRGFTSIDTKLLASRAPGNFSDNLSMIYSKAAELWDGANALQVLGEAKGSDVPKIEYDDDNAEELYFNYHFPGIIYGFKNIGNILFPLLIVVWGIAALAVRYLANNMMAMNLPQYYRIQKTRISFADWIDFKSGSLPSSSRATADYERLVTELKRTKQHYAVLVRPSSARLSDFEIEFSKRPLISQPHGIPIDSFRLVVDPVYLAEIERRIRRSSADAPILIIGNFESVAFDRNRRLLLLDILERHLSPGAIPQLSVVIASDVAPLYMLTQQSHYIGPESTLDYADTQETVRWSRLLCVFHKYYAWDPTEIIFTGNSPWEEVVIRETSAWPELYYLKDVLDEKISNHQLNASQIVQFVQTHAGVHYRRRWNFCTKEEKLALYQLSIGRMMNPKNIEPLQHLMRRGFIRRNPEWRMVNESFADFVRTAEPIDVYAKWIRVAEQSPWAAIRLPLFTVVIAILAILMLTSQDASRSFLAITTSILAIIPMLLKSWTMLRGSPSQIGDQD